MGCAFGVTIRASFGLIDTGRILSGVFHLITTIFGIMRATGTRRARDL